MNIIRAEFPYQSQNLLYWVTFDSDSGVMIDCPLNPNHPSRAEYQDCHFQLSEGKVIITPKDSHPQERRYHRVVEIDLGGAA